uniref:Uncharacterized protein n=1 Tax=Glossina morsitans morsitans TaxID=37546 RepID=A0A1B0GE24_GLOMM
MRHENHKKDHQTLHILGREHAHEFQGQRAQIERINGQISATDFCNFQIVLINGTLITISIQSHTVPAKTFSQEVLICGSLGHLVSKGETTQKEEAVYVDDLHFATSETLLAFKLLS